MAELDRYANVMPEELRDAWRILPYCVGHMNGALIGGTALTTYLFHRQSFDDVPVTAKVENSCFSLD